MKRSLSLGLAAFLAVNLCSAHAASVEDNSWGKLFDGWGKAVFSDMFKDVVSPDVPPIGKVAVASPEAIAKGKLNEALLGEVRRGNEDDVRQLLELGADANALDEDGDSALMLAVANYRKNDGTQIEIAQMLIDKGAYVNWKNTSSRSALMRAAMADKAEFVTFLLSKGAFVNSKDDAGQRALTYAAFYNSIESIRALVRAPGIDLNAQDLQGLTPLMFAAGENNVEVVRLLVKAGAGLDLVGNWPDHGQGGHLAVGFTALMFAASIGNVDVVRILVEKGADRNVVGRSEPYGTKDTALSLAEYYKHEEVIRILKGAVTGDKK